MGKLKLKEIKIVIVFLYSLLSCVFVWRVPHDMVVTMHARLSQQAMRQGKTLDNEIFTDSSSVDFYDPNSNSVDNDYR